MCIRDRFIRINNIYGRAYDIKTKAFKFKGKTEDFDWSSAIKERISACDKVIAKKYVVDIFEDGKSELTAMLKVTWDAVFILMSAPLKKSSYAYSFKNVNGIITDDSMNSKSCAYKLNDIFISRFKPVLEIINANDFFDQQDRK